MSQQSGSGPSAAEAFELAIRACDGVALDVAAALERLRLRTRNEEETILLPRLAGRLDAARDCARAVAAARDEALGLNAPEKS